MTAECGRIRESETVLTVRRGLLRELTAHCNRSFIPSLSLELVSIIHNCSEFVDRSAAERDGDLKQVIPYTIIRQVKAIPKYFLYQRLSGEERLASFYSLGVGGHISFEDSFEERAPSRKLAEDLDLSQFDGLLKAGGVNPERSFLRKGLLRELSEEMAIPGGSVLKVCGVINDESNSVGNVHLGIVFSLSVFRGTARVSDRARNELRGRICTTNEIARLREYVEPWSLVLLRHGLDLL